jgi:3-isopropylmalate/(R)-2-methylmalate dehydratase small subunit
MNITAAPGKIEGKVLFLDQVEVPVADVAAKTVAGVTVLIARGTVGVDFSGPLPEWAAPDRVAAIVAPAFSKPFRAALGEARISAVELPKADLDEAFKTFPDLDTSARVTRNDDGTGKLKLIAGSLSKSYVFPWE